MVAVLAFSNNKGVRNRCLCGHSLGDWNEVGAGGSYMITGQGVGFLCPKNLVVIPNKLIVGLLFERIKRHVTMTI